MDDAYDLTIARICLSCECLEIGFVFCVEEVVFSQI